MNFLSHYYLHEDKNNNYLTVGLTTPDLFGFLSARIRLSRPYLENKYTCENNENIKSFIAGMQLHLFLDSWFHRSGYFSKNVEFLQDHYMHFNSAKKRLAHFYAHILFEILLDKFLLTSFPNIADNFYDSYKKFAFHKITGVFQELPNFNRDKFISIANQIAHSSFLKKYTDNKAVMDILIRVGTRVGLTVFPIDSPAHFSNYIDFTYGKMEPEMAGFFSKAAAESEDYYNRTMNFSN